eukprot:UN00212
MAYFQHIEENVAYKNMLRCDDQNELFDILMALFITFRGSQIGSFWLIDFEEMNV